MLGLLTSALVASAGAADEPSLWFANIFNDHMVLQPAKKSIIVRSFEAAVMSSRKTSSPLNGARQPTLRGRSYGSPDAASHATPQSQR